MEARQETTWKEKKKIRSKKEFDQIASKFRGPQMGVQIRRGRIWRFWGAPIFSPEVPKYLFLKGFGASGRKIGAPQKRQIQPQRIWPPICGPLTINYSRPNNRAENRALNPC